MYEPNKKLGQNFLTDQALVGDFVGYINIQDGDTVIEIGAGLGVVSQELVNQMSFKYFKCYILEIDARFTGKLNDMFNEYQNAIVIETDALQWLPRFDTAGTIKVIGSLPFYITSPLIHAIIKMQTMPSLASLIIQKEVAEKVAARAPDSSYMSVFVQTFYEVVYNTTISRSKFEPQPSVDAAIITMTRRDTYLNAELLHKYEGFLHKGFSHPRKMLNKAFTKEELSLGGITPTLRAEALTADEWFAFFKKLHNIQG